MNYRLKTSRNAKEKLLDLKSSLNITPNILSRYAIALALKQSKLIIEDESFDSNGLEFRRDVLLGDYDPIFKGLFIQKYGSLSDTEYFPDLIKKHIEVGINLLHSEYKYAGNKNKFIKTLLDDEYKLEE